MIWFHKIGLLITHSFNGVITPPGSKLLHVALNLATLNATFFVYEITPPFDAQYSGNSDPVCPLAEPIFKIDFICSWTPYFSVICINAFKFISISSSFWVPALLINIYTFSTFGKDS